ncbi:hypothetical protein ACFU0X_10515 [Streptomyces cellulosae]|uniref:Uncharacterized protein n=1 Tax=Streptomyces cellulosae TaxID=1968 RepID=A0ABW6JEF9_STRCE
MRTSVPITTRTGLDVLALYADVYATRHDLRPPTGYRAFRLGLGPVLMVPEGFEIPPNEDNNVRVVDTIGNGHPAISFSGDEETAYCACCVTITGCWTRDVRAALPEHGLKVVLEPANFSTVSLYLP